MSEENVVVFVGKCDEWWKLKYNTVIQELFNNSLEKIIHFLKHLYKTRRGDEEKHFLKPFFFWGGGRVEGIQMGFLYLKSLVKIQFAMQVFDSVLLMCCGYSP